jgi:hypothetical protein
MFAFALASATAGDSITLRPKVEVPADLKEVRLRDVATLDGTEATRFADLVVAPAPSGERPRIVSPHDIKSRLDAAGIRWDLVDFNGGRVFVQFESADRAKGGKPQAVGAAKAPETTPAATVVPPAVAPPTATPAPAPAPTPAPTPAPAPAAEPMPAVVAIQANDRVTVSRELGAIAIPLTAVALEAGTTGQTIRLQFVDRRGRRDPRAFTAVVTGPGAATVR